MKNPSKLKSLLVLLALSMVVPCVYAKDKKSKSSSSATAPASIDSVSALKGKLPDLTEDQVAQAEKIFAAQSEAISALGQTPDPAAATKIHSDTKEKIDAILTPEQKAQLAAPAASSKKKKK